MKRLLPAIALVLATCTPGGMGAASSASPSPKPGLGFACRLPIFSGDAPLSGPAGGGIVGNGGFLTLPSGIFTLDAASSGGYDHQASKWVPANYRAISPDGTRYAYAEPAVASGGGPPHTGIVHIVDVAPSADHQAATPGPVAVVAWTTSGIYVAAIVPESGAPPSGLSVINPDTRELRQITSTGTWRLVGDRYAWSVDIDPTDPNPPQPQGPLAVGDRVERLDLATAAVSPVITIKGASVFLLGLDAPAQNPWIGSDTAAGYVVMGSPYRTPAFSGPDLYGLSWQGNPITALADSTGMWFASANGAIFHYGHADTAMHQVAKVVQWSPGLAGPCT